MAEGRAVLVVDDEASIRLLCRINLELEGFRVLEAATLPQARAALAEERPALVLLDVHVGVESGYDLLDEIRQRHSELPVVLLTGTDAMELDEVERALADAVLPKPFSLDQLGATVRRLASV